MEIVKDFERGELGEAEAVISVAAIASRSYPVFSALFGMRSFSAPFKPLAPNRGLPDDVSDLAKRKFERNPDAHSPTWVTWQEILAADPDEAVNAQVE